jgi:hypothetical protein
MWKEIILADFEVMSSTYLEGLRKTMENPSQGR